MTVGHYLTVAVLSTSLFVSRVDAQQRVGGAVLDAKVREFWLAYLAGDSATLRRVSVGRQPVRVAYLFANMTGDEARRPIVRPRPPFRVRGDTAWRTYASPAGDYKRLIDYVVRFERRCGEWRIIAITTPAAAH